MTQHVKLARDRRKRKSRLKALIFFFALICICVGGVWSLKDSVEHKPEQPAEEGVAYQSLKEEQTPAQITSDSAQAVSDDQLAQGADDATSYDDELSDKDDESESITIDNDYDTFEPLPKEAQSALDNLLDAAEQAKRITDQFNYTVVRGDSLKDV